MTMNYTRCYQCKGNKKYAPLGYIEKECNVCKGIGHIEQEPKLMPLLYPLDDVQVTTYTKLKKIKKKKPTVLHTDHPLNKLKNKIASVNT